MNLRYDFFIRIVLSFFFLLPFSVQAAAISVDTPAKILLGGDFEVAITINTEGEQINALEGRIIVPAQLRVFEVRDGKSIVPLWIKRPSAGEENEEVAFAGAIPGGFAGKGEIFSLVLHANAAGRGEIALQNMRVLLNDGKATPVSVKTKNAAITVTQGEKIGEGLSASQDRTPPEVFTPAVANDEKLHGGKQVLLFNTQDKDSGIAYYEVTEGDRDPVRAESPYVLQNQSLDEKIIVRAMDNAGNFLEVEMPPQNPNAGKILLMEYGIIAAIFVASVAAVFMFIRKKRNSNLRVGY